MVGFYMDSIPPAKTAERYPDMTLSDPSLQEGKVKFNHGHLNTKSHTMTAFIPLAHTLFIVVQGTSLLNPAYIAACRAGACPTPRNYL
jgi:hypothetical protein